MSRTRRVALIIVAGLVVLTGASTWTANAGALLSLNENQVLYLFSTSAQVLAAIYGLTLSGFVFFLSDLSRTANDDETLDNAVSQLKRDYYRFFIFITVLVTLSLFFTNLVISTEDSSFSRLSVFLINAGQTSYAMSLLSIVVFVFDLMNPNLIEKTSEKLRKQYDPPASEDSHGDFGEFLKNYNQIERRLRTGYSVYAPRETSLKSRPMRHISNVRLADLLLRTERIGAPLHDRIVNLITLRNAAVHSDQSLVSDNAVRESSGVLKELEQAFPDDATVRE